MVMLSPFVRPIKSVVAGDRFPVHRGRMTKSPVAGCAGRNTYIIPNSYGNKGGRMPHSPCKRPHAPSREGPCGEMAEWLKAHAWKACVRETVPWVRIPLSPPDSLCKLFDFIEFCFAIRTVAPPKAT